MARLGAGSAKQTRVSPYHPLMAHNAQTDIRSLDRNSTTASSGTIGLTPSERLDRARRYVLLMRDLRETNRRSTDGVSRLAG